MSSAGSLSGRLHGFGQGAASFLRWWLTELATLLPTRVRSRLHLVREQVELRLSDGAIELNLVTAEGSRALRRFAAHESESALLVETLQAARGKDRRLVLRLSGRAVLVRELALPVAVEENLAQVLRYEMDRYTPFKAEAVYYGYRVLGRDAAQTRLRVQLVAVPRDFLDHWLREFHSWGVHPDRVEADLAPGVNLAPARAGNTRRGPARIRSAMIFLVLALLAAALLLPLWMMREVVVHMNRDVASVQELASRAQALREERDALLAQSRFLSDKKQARYPAVTVLNELSLILPDHTWVQSFQLSNQRVVIQGFSASASALIGQLEASEMFESVSFAAPVTRDAGSDRDVFQISLRVRERQP